MRFFEIKKDKKKNRPSVLKFSLMGDGGTYVEFIASVHSMPGIWKNHEIFGAVTLNFSHPYGKSHFYHVHLYFI
jgi:hypothetical protein